MFPASIFPGSIYSASIFPGSGKGPVVVGPPLPVNLPAAVAAVYRAAPATSAGLAVDLFNGQAKDASTPPFIVFKIPRIPTDRTTSDSQWGDASIGFDCTGPTEKGADDLAQAVINTFKGLRLSFANGATSELVISDRGEGSAGRVRGNARAWLSSVEFSCRVRTGRV